MESQVYAAPELFRLLITMSAYYILYEHNTFNQDDIFHSKFHFHLARKERSFKHVGILSLF